MTLSASVMNKLVKMLQSGELSYQCLGVAVPVLRLFDNSKTTLAQLCEHLHVSANTVKVYLKTMVSLGIIRIETEGGADGGIRIMSQPIKSWSHQRNVLSYISYSYEKEMNQILEHLNKVARRSDEMKFRPTQYIQNMIASRIKEGYTVEDFKKVHLNTADWLLSQKMYEFFRPETLYRADKFPAYLIRMTKATNDLRTTSKHSDPEARQRAKERMARLRAKLERIENDKTEVSS